VDDPSPADPGGPAVYAAYVGAQVVSQEERKSSLEQRGLAVITTSGVLVALLFGLAAVLTGTSGYHLPNGARAPILIALVLFVIAAVAAIVTNLPLHYKGVTADALKKTVEDGWEHSTAEAQREVSLTEIKVFRRAKERNRTKGRALIVAILAEIAAVISLAVAIAVILD
jgi:hypothetical protein